MQQQRMIWLDCLRLLAGLSMVILHTTADPNGQPWSGYDLNDRIGPLVLRQFAYVARTELFLLIGCFLLVMSLNKRPRSYRETITEQTKRLLLPFAFWTVFYAFYSLIKAQQFGYLANAITDLKDPLSWLGYLMLGDVKYHMHFLPTLFGLILFFPLFLIAYDKPVAGLAVFPLLILKWELDRQVWSIFWGTDVLPFVVRLVKLMTYVGFGMAAAALLALYHRQSAKALRAWLPHVLLTALLLFALKTVGTYKTATQAQWQYDYLPGFWADFLMPLVLFFICMALSDRRWPVLLSKVGPYSFGIYLCHPIFVDLSEIALRDTTLMSMAQVTLKLTVALTLTPLLVVLISKLKWLGWTVGLGPLPSPFSKSRKPSSRSNLYVAER